MSVKALMEQFQQQAEDAKDPLRSGTQSLNMRFPKGDYALLKVIAERLGMPPTTLACELLSEAVKEAAETFNLTVQDPAVLDLLRESFGINREEGNAA